MKKKDVQFLKINKKFDKLSRLSIIQLQLNLKTPATLKNVFLSDVYLFVKIEINAAKVFVEFGSSPPDGENFPFSRWSVTWKMNIL